jgi:Flp pilus assembly protein TadG
MMRRHAGDDGGAIPVEFAAALGLLVLPVLVFVMTIAPVVERRTVAGRAAAEAARAFAVADDAATGLAAARSIVDQIDANHPFDLRLTLSGDLERGATVTAEVQVAMPVVIFPGVAAIDVADYRAVHREEVDLYRSLPP